MNNKTMTHEKTLEIRKKLDLSQKEMGEKIGVVWQSISGYENGKPIPASIGNLYKLISEYEEIKGLLKRIEYSILECKTDRGAVILGDSLENEIILVNEHINKRG